jgi:hypothetical protein
MKIINKTEMEELPRGTVFAKYYPNMGLELHQIEIKDDYEFGATTLMPDEDGEIFDYDWNINDYNDNDKFIIFEEKEILQMIKLLMRGILPNIGD